MTKTSRFRPNTEILEAKLVPPPAFTRNQKMRGVRRAGITFEEKVGEVLERKFHGMVIHGAWVDYYDSRLGERSCSPDYLVVDVRSGIITVVECKLSHTHHAWQQLNDVYKPVIEFLFPGFEIRGIEVCKNFERSKYYPVTPKIVCDWDADFRGGDNVMVMYG